jgi:hypothetical protein
MIAIVHVGHSNTSLTENLDQGPINTVISIIQQSVIASGAGEVTGEAGAATATGFHETCALLPSVQRSPTVARRGMWLDKPLLIEKAELEEGFWTASLLTYAKKESCLLTSTAESPNFTTPEKLTVRKSGLCKLLHQHNIGNTKF